ncbi:MAG TPA: polysaccharide deacetylase family protein, partial [Chthoniobacteraceae bacterium]|nr:polysaccharide deacetylase family protein [Chthoniobacteraceae bacterium]
LEFLRRHRMRATFFVVGEIAERFPGTIRAIAAEGHELACHTWAHLPLESYDARTLRDDLERNRDALAACASAPVTGFRAPILSLTEKCRWVYALLAELGFEYSSSVLPAKNPLHGWPGFGAKARRIDGVFELPVTLARFVTLKVPIGAGTYFRCLPFFAIAKRFEQHAARGLPVVGYFHPYDIDTAQERVMSRGVRGSRVLNSLLYINRAKTLRRLESIVAAGFEIVRCDDFVSKMSHA